MFDATQLPLKPVYLRYRILRGGLEDQSRASTGSGSGPGSGPGSGSWSASARVLDPSISDLSIY